MKTVIVGGGVTGLTLGYLLLDRGFEVTILEKQREVGGLARSFHYDGWSIDIGPHRFHTVDEEVNVFLNEIMGNDLIEIERLSKVFFQGVHLEWPLTFSSLMKLPPLLMLRSGWDLMFRPKLEGASYESYVLSKYGRTLTDHFFREYNHKFLKMELKDCHRHWAEAGINRALIDKGIKEISIVDLLFNLFSRKRAASRFLYPKSGPIDVFSRKLKEKIISRGGKIELGINVVRGEVNGGVFKNLVSEDGRSWEADFVFWTGVIQDLEKIVALERSPLEYSSTIFCNLLISGKPPVPSQWEYFGNREAIFCRSSTNIFFNPILAPANHYGIALEIICAKDDYVWRNAESFFNSMAQNLIEYDIIRNFNSIEDVHFEWIDHTYPIYDIDYFTHLQEFKMKMEKFDNILCCGRTGGFWYNNMDHSIKSSLNIVKKIVDSGLNNSYKGLYRGESDFT